MAVSLADSFILSTTNRIRFNCNALMFGWKSKYEEIIQNLYASLNTIREKFWLKFLFCLFGWIEPLTVRLYASLWPIFVSVVCDMMHYSLHPMVILLHPHVCIVCQWVCVYVRFCVCLLKWQRMSFSRVLCVRDHRSMCALSWIAANSVFIFLNKWLPFPDTLCFFFFFPCCHWWADCKCGSVYAFSHTCFCKTKSQ